VPEPAVRAALATDSWHRERTLTTLSGTAVLLVRTAAGDTGVLKIAATGSGAASLRREHAVLEHLAEQDKLGGWRELLPVPLRWGDANGSTFLLTSRLGGRDGRLLSRRGTARFTGAAFAAIAPLHGLGGTVTVVEAALLSRWLDEPMAWLATVGRPARAVGRVAGTVRAGLAGRWVRVGWTHGDFHPGNVLAGPDGAVAGIVDWDQAAERDLIAMDLASWILSIPGRGRQRELGARVAARLAAQRCWTPAESRLLGLATTGDPAEGRALLLLTWLRQVAGSLARSDRYTRSPLWLRNNIRPVLRQAPLWRRPSQRRCPRCSLGWHSARCGR
jgi:Ser/Thr protein kinase RdoA (MazF antagonist)